MYACAGTSTSSACPIRSVRPADATIPLVVPLFHVNAWGLPYAAAMTGAKLVLPGPHLDGKSIYDLLRDERVTLAAGVPTIWQIRAQAALGQAACIYADTSSQNRSRSILPPLMMMPMRLPFSASFICMAAARPRQPVGSTIIFMRVA